MRRGSGAIDQTPLMWIVGKHYNFLFLLCFVSLVKRYFQVQEKFLIATESGSTCWLGVQAAAPYLLLADCLAPRPGLASLCQAEGSKQLCSSAGFCSVASKLISCVFNTAV